MPDAYELNRLDPHTFEHLVNTIAMRVLGLGVSSFSPGADAGRDGYFEGEAPYPSETERWSGVWYLQSKFHKPHLSKDPQKWLLEQIKTELESFQSDELRKWPDNWLVISNIDPSGVPETGSFDRAREMVRTARPALASRFHIWGASKVQSLLSLYPGIAKRYAHLITPGDVLAQLLSQLDDTRAEVDQILRYLIVKQFDEQLYTRLEQAGSGVDSRPGIHKLFIDLPFLAREHQVAGLAIDYLTRAAARPLKLDTESPDTEASRRWRRHPSRARVWFVKGGPGQGKSTVGQYFCQVQRAGLILDDSAPRVTASQKALAKEIKLTAQESGYWPSKPRIPITVELKDYAQWYGRRTTEEASGILTFLASKIGASVEATVLVGTLRRALKESSWFVAFDGLDEVPHDVKDRIANEVRHFLDDVIVELDADVLALCTSRPQGYAGQFDELDGTAVELQPLRPDQAIACATPVLKIGRTEDEYTKSIATLTAAIESPAVRELMTSPLQAHIMAIVVRDGGKPPERRWQLFTNFYQVIKKREANRNLPDRDLARLLREDEQLLKTLHTRLGFLLHARAETSEGAQTRLNKVEFQELAHDAVSQLVEGDIEKTVETLMRATVDRLVLVSTPDDGNHVRFDIRPLQEFFAAEFLYESVSVDQLAARVEIIAGDSHWREVMHFLLSALIENGRLSELAVAIRALNRLNEGDGELFARPLARALARGSLLTARLLVEGVLEQDRRIRSEFRHALEPVAGTVDSHLRMLLASVQHPNSVAWLERVMLDYVREFASTENVGAVSVLAQLQGAPSFSDADADVGLNYVGGGDLAFQLTAASEAYALDPNKKCALWLLRMTAETLLGDRWRSLSPSGLEAAFNVLQHESVRVLGMRRVAKLSARQRAIFRWLLSEGRPVATGPIADYGVILALPYSRDWTGPNEGFDLPTADPEVDCDRSVIALADKILAFSGKPTAATLCEALAVLPSQELLREIPQDLMALLPLDLLAPWQPQLEELASLADEEVTGLLSEGEVRGRKVTRPASLRVVEDGTCNHAQWRNLIADHPRVALWVWSDEFWLHRRARRPRTFDVPPNIDVLVSKVIRTPTLLAAVPELWGRLLTSAPRRETELREAFLRASRSDVVLRSWVAGFHTFTLNLPTESSLLPHLVLAILSRQNVPRYGVEGSTNSVQLIREMVTDHRDLREIAEADYLSSLVHAAGLLLHTLHVADLDLNAAMALGNAYRAEFSTWYLMANASLLQLLGSERSRAARYLVGQLFDSARGDFEGRAALTDVLDVWREQSQAPVTQAGAATSWLRGP